MLNSSFRKILLRQPRLGVVKESNNPKDFMYLIHVRKGDVAYQIENPKDLEDKIKDKKDTKRYFSEELQDEFKIYALAQLGIEFLSFKADIDNLEKAQKIFDNSFYEKMDKFLGSEHSV